MSDELRDASTSLPPPPPLHVRVAIALGWTHPLGLHDCCLRDDDEIFDSRSPYACAPRYDTDWAATGPLVVRFDLTVGPTYAGLAAPGPWSAIAGSRDERHGVGWTRAATPLLAICHLILELAAAGKLDDTAGTSADQPYDCRGAKWATTSWESYALAGPVPYLPPRPPLCHDYPGGGWLDLVCA